MNLRTPRRIGKFDLLIYRLFYWRWKPLLENDPKLLMLFKNWIDGWIEQERVDKPFNIEGIGD